MEAGKVRVLYICIDNSLGGSTASLYNLIDGIRDFIEPIVLFPQTGEGYRHFRDNGIEAYVYPFVQLYEFKKNKFAEVWRHPWGWHYIKKVRKDFNCYFFIKKVLAERKIDIVHSNTSPNDIGVLLSCMLHAKHVWHVRESCQHFDIYRGETRLRKLINHADARIAISNSIKELWKMPNQNTWVIPDAVRKQKDACYIQTKEKYVLFSAYNLTELKGTRFAIQAFAISGAAKDGYRLKLMGNCDESYHKSLCQTAQEYGVMDSVDFIPCQTDVKPYYAHATAYIMSSEFEGLGRVTAEAMFYGCPVIARATGGTLDIVKDEKTGYLFNTLDECAQLIRNVCSENQEQIILQSQDFAINNLSQEVYAPKIMDVYDKVMSNKTN